MPASHTKVKETQYANGMLETRREAPKLLKIRIQNLYSVFFSLQFFPFDGFTYTVSSLFHTVISVRFTENKKTVVVIEHHVEVDR
jgi:hypothetical protein